MSKIGIVIVSDDDKVGLIMYVMCVVGNTMKKRAIRKAALHRVQNGKIFRMILNAPYVQLAKISFLRLSKEVQQDL